MIRPWHLLVFALALAAFCALGAPASLFVRPVPGVLTFEQINGSIWDTRFLGARIGPYAAGQVRTRVHALDLFFGRLHVDADAAGADVTGRASLQADFGGERRLQAPMLSFSGLPLRSDLALAGTTSLTDADIRFQDGRCASATGAAASDVLVRNGNLVRWSGPELVGGVRCVGDEAEIEMSGSDENGRYALRTFLSADGSGRWRLEAVTGKLEAGVALAALGFRPDPSGALALSGEFQWLPF